jgi:hypothetical protein
MVERRCPYCHQLFSPAKCQPKQAVCSAPECQCRRCADYRRARLAGQEDYREACRQSARQWRKQHPDYWTEYRSAHPDSADRNRQMQRSRDRKRRLKSLANNTPASELIPCPATIWLLGPGLRSLANNTSAATQLWVLEGLSPSTGATGQLANNTALAQ